MTGTNINDLNIDEMLIKAETTVAVLRVVYNLQEVDDYTKEDAAQELMDFLYASEMSNEIYK